MTATEIRLKCLDAASRLPVVPGPGGYAAALVAAARELESYVAEALPVSGQPTAKPLGLPKK